MFFRMVYKSGQIFLPFCYNTRVWQTDRQTDRQTDGRTEFSSQYRVCITCSAVKMKCPKYLARLVVSYSKQTNFNCRNVPCA